ncbi:hypothetical protein C8Q73DRAFT_674433 [Cubamyces lactineus]|nr:hypothetical protein C8Q73DRAFT_674433 [Cubamyces lactineus]
MPSRGPFGMGHPPLPWDVFNPFVQQANQTFNQPVAPSPTSIPGNTEERSPIENTDSSAPTAPEPSTTAPESSAPSTTLASGRERQDSVLSDGSIVSYATAPQLPARSENEESTDSPGAPSETQRQTDEQHNTASVDTDSNTVTSNVQKAEPTNGSKAQTYYCPDLYTFRIRGGEGEVTEWYESHGPRTRELPPAPIRRLAQERGADIGCLHVHTHDSGTQAWMLDLSGPLPRRHTLPAGVDQRRELKLVWRRVHVGKTHPRLRGLVLHFLKNGEPRWVRPASLKKYAQDKKKLDAMIADDTSE